MSAHQKSPKTFGFNGSQKRNYKDFLDFGDATENAKPTESNDVQVRLKNLVKQLQEINRRIDTLNNRY